MPLVIFLWFLLQKHSQWLTHTNAFKFPRGIRFLYKQVVQNFKAERLRVTTFIRLLMGTDKNLLNKPSEITPAQIKKSLEGEQYCFIKKFTNRTVGDRYLQKGTFVRVKRPLLLKLFYPRDSEKISMKWDRGLDSAPETKGCYVADSLNTPGWVVQIHQIFVRQKNTLVSETFHRYFSCSYVKFRIFGFLLL